VDTAQMMGSAWSYFSFASPTTTSHPPRQTETSASNLSDSVSATAVPQRGAGKGKSHRHRPLADRKRPSTVADRRAVTPITCFPARPLSRGSRRTPEEPRPSLAAGRERGREGRG